MLIAAPLKLTLCLLAVASVALGTATTETTSTCRAPRGFAGINDDPVWNYQADEITTFSRLLKESRAHSIRLPIRWRVLEPAAGQTDYTSIDRALAAIPPEVEILGVLMSVPQWANGMDPATAEGYADSYPPNDLAHWDRYVNQTVARYKGRIRHWEILNEQNGIDFYRPMPDAAGYTALLKSAYGAAKRADPGCVVVLGGLQSNGILPNPWSPVKIHNFLPALYDAGAGPYFDVCNIHPYVLPAEGAAHMMTLIQDTFTVMNRHGDTTKTVWLTEVGSGARTAAEERDQADLLAATYDLACREPRIQRVYWFLLRDMEKDLLGPEGSMGLFTHNGRAKPALGAFQKAADAISVGAEKSAPKALNP